MEKNHVKTLLALLLLFSISTEAKELIQVKIAFMEALAPKDTTSSERFQKEYDYAVLTGTNLTKQKLKDCGYELSDEKVFYDASDNLQALEEAKKSDAAGAWFIVGPRRSNHYLLAVKGAPTTPSVSIMASSNEVFDLDSIHLTIAQSNKNLARIAAHELSEKLKRKSLKYISLVNEDCVSCKDFALNFDLAAKKIKFSKLKEHFFVGEQPDISFLEKPIKELQPDFVLLPNYSMVSAYLMGIIHSWNPNIFFVGGDGWGDSNFGFVHSSPQLSKVNGLTVKGFPPTEKGLAFFPLGQQILKKPELVHIFPTSGAAQALLKTIDGVSEFLCKYKPKTKAQFAEKFKDNGRNYFNNPWGVSVFKLSQGEISFEKTIK